MIAVVATIALAAPASAAHHRPKVDGCRTRSCHRRVAHKRSRRIKLRVVAPYRARLERIARCESAGRWHINTGNGYYGGLQFSLTSWRAVGGRGYPHVNSKLEQMFRAVKLARVQGWNAWPICSVVAG